MTAHGIMQQSHSVSPQSHPKQGFVVPLIGFAMEDVVEEVEGGMAVYDGPEGFDLGFRGFV